MIYCAITAMLGCVCALFACVKKDNRISVRHSLNLKAILVMIFLGMAAYGGNFFLLLAADKVPASVQFPLVSGGVILLSASVSVFLFKEKISKVEWISVLGAFASTFLFAF